MVTCGVLCDGDGDEFDGDVLLVHCDGDELEGDVMVMVIVGVVYMV